MKVNIYHPDTEHYQRIALNCIDLEADVVERIERPEWLGWTIWRIDGLRSGFDGVRFYRGSMLESDHHYACHCDDAIRRLDEAASKLVGWMEPPVPEEFWKFWEEERRAVQQYLYELGMQIRPSVLEERYGR